MRILICIDDTDDIYKDISTGAIAQMIFNSIEKNDWGKCEPITRHQLLLNEAIPYTSHNSSMCFRAEINGNDYENVLYKAVDIIEENMASDSDPGLCVVKEGELRDKDALIDFGYRAKKEVLTKEEAYRLAKKLNVHLTEHGGTGLGIIGALAGTGLRLSGNDGEFKGRVNIGKEGDIFTVKELESYHLVDEVQLINGEKVDKLGTVILGKTNKTILKDNKAVFLVKKVIENENNYYQSCSKHEIRNYSK